MLLLLVAVGGLEPPTPLTPHYAGVVLPLNYTAYRILISIIRLSPVPCVLCVAILSQPQPQGFLHVAYQAATDGRAQGSSRLPSICSPFLDIGAACRLRHWHQPTPNHRNHCRSCVQRLEYTASVASLACLTMSKNFLRKERDSNPRSLLRLAALATLCLWPLGHPSSVPCNRVARNHQDCLTSPFNFPSIIILLILCFGYAHRVSTSRPSGHITLTFSLGSK